MLERLADDVEAFEDEDLPAADEALDVFAADEAPVNGAAGFTS